MEFDRVRMHFVDTEALKGERPGRIGDATQGGWVEFLDIRPPRSQEERVALSKHPAIAYLANDGWEPLAMEPGPLATTTKIYMIRRNSGAAKAPA